MFTLKIAQVFLAVLIINVISSFFLTKIFLAKNLINNGVTDEGIINIVTNDSLKSITLYNSIILIISMLVGLFICYKVIEKRIKRQKGK